MPLTTAGATSLMHEAVVDVVAVPNLSEHLGSADTTAQLSARFAYAAAMKSINNLLGGCGRCAGDAVARPVAGGSLDDFRPPWQLDAPSKAALALSKAQATAVYAGLGLWPASVTAELARAQLAEDGTYPNAAAVFAGGGAAEVGDAAHASPTRDFDPAQRRDPDGRWTAGGGSAFGAASVILASGNETEREEEKALEESGLPPSDPEPDAPVLKPLPGVAAHGVLSRVPMPIPPRPLGAPAAASGLQPTTTPPRAGPPNQTIKDLARVTRGFAGRKSAQKWLNQMNGRGWTPEQIEEAIQGGERTHESQRIDPTHGATRYVHPHTGRSVTIDEVTGEIIQLGGDDFDY